MIYFEKSYPAPTSLATEKAKSSGQYGTEEVLKRLREDFKDKCYLCETKKLTSINVEHLISHRDNIDLKFDWDNLFWCCAHCNNIKLHLYDNILNCTKKEDDVEQSLKYEMPLFPKASVRITALKGDIKTVRTAELLNKVYNGTTTSKTFESENIKSELKNELLKFRNMLDEYYELDVSEVEDREIYKKNIIRNLKNYSAFTAFKRWIIREIPGLFEDFGEFITDDEVKPVS